MGHQSRRPDAVIRCMDPEIRWINAYQSARRLQQFSGFNLSSSVSDWVIRPTARLGLPRCPPWPRLDATYPSDEYQRERRKSRTDRDGLIADSYTSVRPIIRRSRRIRTIQGAWLCGIRAASLQRFALVVTRQTSSASHHGVPSSKRIDTISLSSPPSSDGIDGS